MQPQTIHPYLEDKKVPALYKTLKESLSSINSELGLLFINEMPEYRDKSWSHSENVVYGSNRFNRIRELLGENEWKDPSNYRLLCYLFGEIKAPYVKLAWENMPFQMYQDGHARRSFRAPHNKELCLRRQIELIVDLIPQSYSQGWNEKFDYVYTYYDLDIVDQVKWAHTIGDGNANLFRLWAAAVDMGNTSVFAMLENIIYNKDEQGKVTRSIIKALLNSNKPEAWVLVEKLLLAAQRQEGLRQTILESLDETSTGGLKYIIKVIIDHQLARFSSVVRAVDVWAGLGWESERETTVRSFLEKAHLYLENPAIIPDAVKSNNNTEVYMALWAQGVYDVEQTFPFLWHLYKNGSMEKRLLAVIFAGETAHYNIQMPLFIAALNDQELPPLAYAVICIQHLLYTNEHLAYYNHHFPELFNLLNDTYQRITIKEKTFESTVFSWQKVTFERKTILRVMLMLVGSDKERLNLLLSYFEEMDAGLKRTLSQVILPKHAEYSYRPGTGEILPLTEFQRNYALQILKDRSEHEIAFKALYGLKLSAEELSPFPELLKRKAADFRNKLIALLLNQEDALLAPVIERVLLQGDGEQRTAGLDLLLQLRKSNRLTDVVTGWIKRFKERRNISAKEEVLLSQLSEEHGFIPSPANGYGLFDPGKMSPVISPQINPENCYEKLLAMQPYAFSMPMDELKAAFTDLKSILDKHSDYEYEVTNWDNSKTKILLGNSFRNKTSGKEFITAREEYENYPLYDLWQDWFIKWNLQPQDLFIIGLYNQHFHGNNRDALVTLLPDVSVLMPDNGNRFWHYNNPLINVAVALQLIYPFEMGDEFCIGATTRLFASLSDKILQAKDERDHYYQQHRGWQHDTCLNIFLQRIDLATMPEQHLSSCWQLYNWRQYSGLPENTATSVPPVLLFCRAFKAGVISEDEMYRGVATTEGMDLLSGKKLLKDEYPYLEKFPFLEQMFERVKDMALDLELKRGDSGTSVTALTSALQRIYGVNRFAEILTGLGKTTLYKGYIYNYNGGADINKQQSFSVLLKNCYPLDTDNQQLFNQWMQKTLIPESRLIEAAMYAPQWQKLISNYLGWKGLDSAIWWMHAHTKTDAYQAQNAEAESEIARYSTLDVDEFKEGAVDKDWFHKAYREIGKDRWPMVYDAAKYISDGNGHRRARIYADVLLGNLSLKDVAERVKSRRDQDYLRIYGLVPLSKTKAAKDILTRYEYLQQFKKESRQFGAQKQTSEARAIEVAMENLARNAGYIDPVRLTWAMETKQVQDILSKQTQVQYDDVLIGLVVDEQGEADVVAFKEEKQLKAVPAKYKKDKKVEELNGYKKTLREQWKRARKGLEEAMVRGDSFLLSEIETLFTHPVISRHLEHLVFVVADDISRNGFYRFGKLYDGVQEIDAGEDARLRIAHCTDLYRSGKWAGYQRYAFDKQIKQPFKQIFRELYLPTEDELAEKAISRRYAGHQVQPKQTVALLKSRGWKVDYESGLQKVFHKEGFVAKMYAMADWFSPAEVESPTLETVQFHYLKTFKNVDFEKIDSRIFSEVMRDIDLVVSVAHAGGVDAEASHSSIEMRTLLLKETLRLFKVQNVEVSGSHARIKGTISEYSVHLGSAVAHRIASGYLSIIPVHSQQRGRLFLPFADDDPKSAEVISKVLLLARDQDIQDPTILRQLR